MLSSTMDTNTVQLPAGDSAKKNKRRKRRERKNANKTDDLLNMDHITDNLEVPGTGKICAASKSDLRNNLFDLDSIAQPQTELSKMDTRPMGSIAEGTVQIERKKRKRNKKKVQSEGKLQSLEQMDGAEVPDIGKTCMVVNNNLQSNLVELDSTAELHKEQSSLDTRSTENLAEGAIQIKRKRRIRNKKKAKSEGELQNADQMDDHSEGPDIGKTCTVVDNNLQSNLVELYSTAELHEEQARLNTWSTENLAEWTVQMERKRRKRNKKKATSEGQLQSVDQMDGHLEDPNIGKVCTLTNNNLKNNLVELDSTAELQKEQSGPETWSTENLAQVTVQIERKKRKQKKKKANSGIQGVDQMGDHSKACNIVKICTAPNSDLQNRLTELGSIAELQKEQSLLNTRLSESITETVESKKRRKHKNKAKKKDEIRTMDQKADNLEASGIGISCTIANDDLQHNLIKLDSSALAEHPEIHTGRNENISEEAAKKRKRKRRRKKVKNRDELQSVDQRDSNLEVPSIGTSYNLANDDLQNDLIKIDSAAKSQAEESKLSRSREDLEEGAVQKKRRRRKQKKENKDKLQNVDVVSSLNLSDENLATRKKGKKTKNGTPVSLLHSVHDTTAPVAMDEHKKTAVAPSSQNSYSEFLEQGCGPLEGPKTMEVEMASFDHRHIAILNEKSDKNEKTEDDFMEEEIIVYRGKVSAPSSSRDVEVTKQLSCSNVKEGDHLSKDLCPHLEIPPVALVRRKLLVLDVNGLLADIVMPAPKDCIAHTRILGRAILRRPFCDDFLQFCFDNFDVAIWSSRSKRVIEKVVDYILGDLQYKLLFCWDMSHSTQTRFKTLENKHKPLVMKELKKIWERKGRNLPWEKGYYNESNTLLLDDSPYKALLNPLHTAIFPYSYSYKDKSDNSLGLGGDIRVYLEDMLKCDNVQKYVEQHPFGQGAIDETHRNWSFYSKVLKSVSSRV